MRVIYVTQPYPPMVSGAALKAQQLAEGMAARGHAVLVLTASDRREAYVTTAGNLRIFRASSFRNPTRVDQCFTLWPQREISTEMHTFRPEILHLHDPLGVILCPQRIANSLGIPVVFTIHSLPSLVTSYVPQVPGLRRSIEKGLWGYTKWLKHRCEALVVPSNTIAMIAAEHIDHQPKVISNGVDLERFHPQPIFPRERETLVQQYGLVPHLPVILSVGRIDPDKRIDVAIRASSRAMQAVDAQLLVVGSGLQREAMMRLSEELGIRERTHFPGFISVDGDLPGVFRLASVFVSASEIEVQSSTTLEAAATGLPVVSVRATSMPEIVQDGVTGYLVPPGDIDAMANRLVSLLRQPEQAVTLGMAGRALAQKHSLGATFEAHESLYRSLQA